MENTEEEYQQQIVREIEELREKLRVQLTEWHVALSRPTAFVFLSLAAQCVDGDDPDDVVFLITTVMKLATGNEPVVFRKELGKREGEEN